MTRNGNPSPRGLSYQVYQPFRVARPKAFGETWEQIRRTASRPHLVERTLRPGMSLPKRKVKVPVAKPVIGWREWIKFPDLRIESIKAKVDTGARTSSLHAFDLEEFEKDGGTWVRFMVHPEQRKSTPTIPVELPLKGKRRVRDSGGKAELRPVVEARVELMGQSWPIEITLTSRDAMGFRMLLGRQGIRGRFLVDPGGSFYGGRRIRKKTSASKRSGRVKSSTRRSRK